jgi:hypothetical protein
MIARLALAAVLLALPLAARAQTPLAAPGKPGWTPVAKDCFVWNRAPGKDEIATWSGTCVNQRAEGKGVLVWRSGGAQQRYEGEMHDGRLSGSGTYVYAPGVTYQGGFKDDDFDGKGTLTEQGARYEGAFKAGRKNGHGLLTTTDGDRYDGEFADDKMTGRGTLVLSDGRKYEGLLQDGKPNGQGTLTDPSGTYTGIWQNGCFADGTRKAALGVDPTTCK